MTAPMNWARIVIVAFNSGDDLQTCIDHLAAQTCQDFEVVVVDNASADGAAQALVFPDNKYRMITSEDNLGFAAGSNLGALGAQTQWIFSLNPDARVTPTWLETAKSASDSAPDFDMLSPVLLRASDRTLIDGCGDVLSGFGFAWRGGHLQSADKVPKFNRRVFSPCGACAGFRRALFERAGGFDPTFFCYVEDVDLGLRFTLAGKKCLLIPDSIVLHKGAGTLGEGHPFTLYHSYRNTVFMIAKNFPVLNLMFAIFAFPASVLWILTRNPKMAHRKDILRGLLHGYKAVPRLLFHRLKGIDRAGLRSQNRAYIHLTLSRRAMRARSIISKPID